jgi:hypothetical protein
MACAFITFRHNTCADADRENFENCRYNKCISDFETEFEKKSDAKSGPCEE